MEVQIVTPYRVGNLQCYGITVRSNVTNVYPPLYGEYHRQSGWDMQHAIQTPSTAKKNEGSDIFALPYASLAYRRAELLLYSSSFSKVKTSKHVWVACHEI
jgi:hypothetical protein